jgi:hypothetical protein
VNHEATLGFDDTALGRGLPAEVEALIARAGALRHAPPQAEALLLQARAMAPTHPAPLIALYRFHFYGHRLREARAVAQQALAVAREALGPAFGRVPPSNEQARFDAAVRFYLFTLKGQAYLSLRLGEIDAGRAALAELRRLDPQDCVGGAVLAQVLGRQGRSDDDEGFDAARTPRGWSPEVPA